LYLWIIKNFFYIFTSILDIRSHHCSCLGSSVGLIFTLDIWFFRHFLCFKSLLRDISELTSLNCTRCMDKAKTCMFTLFQKNIWRSKRGAWGHAKSSFFLRRNNSENTYMSEKLQNDLSTGDYKHILWSRWMVHDRFVRVCSREKCTEFVLKTN